MNIKNEYLKLMMYFICYKKSFTEQKKFKDFICIQAQCTLNVNCLRKLPTIWS